MLLLDKIYSTIWLATPETVAQIESVVKRHETTRLTSKQLQALSAKLGKPLENSNYAEVRGSTALIPVRGAIVSKGNMFTDVSGLTSTSKVALDLNQALENPDVKSIVMDFSSGGGEVEGINELANMIREASQQKPVKAYVSGRACSAAYWLASATEEVVLDATAEVGSIGVAVFITDDSEADEREGIKRIVYKSSKSPNKLVDATDPDAASLIQQSIDTTAQVFLESVAKFRSKSDKKLTADYVAENFKSGGTAIGQEAVNLGMADRLGSLEGLLKELNQENDMSKEKTAETLVDTAQVKALAEANDILEGSLKEKAELEEKLAAFEGAEEKLAAFEAMQEKLSDFEAMQQELDKYREAIEEKNARILDADAKEAADQLSGKFTTDEHKTEFVALYKKLNDDKESQEAFVKFVGAQPDSSFLKEEVISNQPLKVLPVAGNDEDDFTGLDDAVSKYAAKYNKGE